MNPPAIHPITRMAWITGTLLLAALAWTGQVNAQQLVDGSPADDVGSDWIALPAETLDRLRGGFILPSGLLMSFGIERAVYVDGQLVATARFNVPDIARITVDQANALAVLQDTLLVQVGEGNTFVPNGMGGIVVQNTLPDIDIRALTTINVASSTLGLFQDLNFNSALQGALASAPGGL